MPVTFDSNIERKEGLYEALPQEIEVRPDMNGRHEKPDIEWLVKDILEHGQMQPVGIWKDGETAVLAFGFSRWRAISEINKRKLTPQPLKIRCTYIKCNEQGAFVRNISENRMRNATTPIDDAHNIDKLIESWQLSEREVAAIYFPLAATAAEVEKALKWVQERLALIKLVPEAAKALESGRFSETAAQAIAKLSSAQQRELMKREGKITTKDAKAAKPAKAGEKRGRKPAPIGGELKRRITAVLESADWDNFDEKAGLKICVDADALAALKNYIDEK
jgi:ParB-like chromosome segregation protein Spo0J